MGLAPDSKLGPYKIQSLLGAGGMGEVYRALDTRLDRDVAIKVLPEALAKDKERILRFEREAKVLASLNHPNIAAIYGFEEFQGKRFLIMELAEGETLAERLARGPLPVRDALEFASGIALALEAAHEKGIIHRDLKPANVKVTPDGTIKVLDFGLAKAMTGEATGTDIANSPTITMEHTRPGVVLGTAAYMSPEQARGRTLDKRTDIWSFGAMLFECLTGTRPFLGETTSDLVAQILEREPNWSTLPPGTPPLVQLLLRRCLAKDRNKRLRDIGDARVEIESALHDPTTSGLLLTSTAIDRTSVRRGSSAVLLIVVALLVGLVGVGVGWRLSAPNGAMPRANVVRFDVDCPKGYELRDASGSNLGRIALNPEGTQLAFSAERDGVSHLFTRDFSSNESRLLPNTEGGSNPVFSPDGRWIAFQGGGKLKKIPSSGGPALTLTESARDTGAWLPNGDMVMTSPGGGGLLRIPGQGSAPVSLAKAGIDQRTTVGDHPVLGFQDVCAVPDADYVLAGIWNGDTNEDYAVVAVGLKDGVVRLVMQNAIDPSYLPPGDLLFVRGSSIMAAPFDPIAAEVVGEAVEVVSNVMSSKWADEAKFSVSQNGTLAYVPGGRRGPGRRLIRVDATGKAEPLMNGTDALVGGLHVSPDGASMTATTLRRDVNLWNFNFARRSLSLINNVGETWSPTWTPDGQHVLFQQIIPAKSRGMVRKRADGSGAVERLEIDGSGDVNPNSISPDGELLLYTMEYVSSERLSDIALHRLDQPGSVELVVSTPADETGARFAPDGKHFAYNSNETGRYEVFLGSLEAGASKRQVSHNGGSEPAWSRDGKTLYFIDAQNFMQSVAVDLDAGPSVSAPTRLFDITTIATTDVWGTYDVLPDGGFVMIEPAEWERVPPRIRVVLNWSQELHKK